MKQYEDISIFLNKLFQFYLYKPAIFFEKEEFYDDVLFKSLQVSFENNKVVKHIVCENFYFTLNSNFFKSRYNNQFKSRYNNQFNYGFNISNVEINFNVVKDNFYKQNEKYIKLWNIS